MGDQQVVVLPDQADRALRAEVDIRFIDDDDVIGIAQKDPLDLWLVFPLHEVDHTDLLADCKPNYGGVSEARKLRTEAENLGKVASLEGVCDRLIGRGESCERDEVRKSLGWSLPTVRRWLEESSRFGCATIGSSLVTGHQGSDQLADLKDSEGITLGQVFHERGYSLNPPLIRNVRQYLELHIEQGKSLESRNLKAGIVTGIAAPHRWNANIIGMADHSGATPMDLRSDSLAAAAELILRVEQIGRQEPDSVATVGVIHNEPNVMNVVPGNTRIGIDLRSAKLSHLEHMDTCLKEKIAEIETERGVKIHLSSVSNLLALMTILAQSLLTLVCGHLVALLFLSVWHSCEMFI